MNSLTNIHWDDILIFVPLFIIVLTIIIIFFRVLIKYLYKNLIKYISKNKLIFMLFLSLVACMVIGGIHKFDRIEKENKTKAVTEKSEENK